MNDRIHKIHVLARVVWRSNEQLKRVLPPADSTSFAALGRLSDNIEPEYFSVVVLYPEPHQVQEAGLHFFAPDLVLPRMQVGTKLSITDGYKVLADAEVLEVRE